MVSCIPLVVLFSQASPSALGITHIIAEHFYNFFSEPCWSQCYLMVSPEVASRLGQLILYCLPGDST